MLLKNRKGITFVELLIVMAIIGIVTPLLFVVFVSGIEDYSTTSKYLDQQYTAMEVIRHIRQDVEEAKKVVITISGGKITAVKFEFPAATPAKPDKEWKFDAYSGKSGLMLNGTMVVENLDVNNSKFEVDDLTNPTRLILIIKPVESNKKYPGRNVNEEIITEFSVRDKLVEK